MQIQYFKDGKVSYDVVICFKFSNFAYANTVDYSFYEIQICCYLL